MTKKQPISILKPELTAALHFAKPHKQEIDAPPRSAMKKHLSGLIPKGDVRLTANISQNHHLKLKIAAAQKRTTIGELIEQMVDQIC